MKLINKIILIHLLIANCLLAESIDITSPHLENIIIIKVKPEYRLNCEVNKINEQSLSQAFNNIGIESIKKKFPTHSIPEKSVNKYGQKLVYLALIYEIKTNGNMDLAKAISLLDKTNKLEYAQPHYTQQIFYTPNDPSIALQYYLGTINAYTAWDISQGDTNTVIGVTDTGTEIYHPDLELNLKFNYLDTIDGIDNDTDGYVDNYFGWDLGENDNVPQCSSNYHGIFTTGICSATPDNNIGIAGVGFKAKYLPVKIDNAAGVLSASYEGIVYAADHGCIIINCSWGGTGAGQYGQDIVNYVTNNIGCLVIASAGNDGTEELFYPASYDNVLSVAASDVLDHKKANSSYGIAIDVCAPGEDIYSTWVNGTYLSSGGTSAAAPVVSGAAAIVHHYLPALSPLQIGEQLKATCDIIDTIGFNQPYAGKLGRGRINLYRALTETNLPSIVMTQHNETDNNDNAFVIGDTIRLSETFINYLANASAVSVSITANSPYISFIDSVFGIGNLNTMQSANNSTNPFTAKVLTGAPQNATVEFKLTAIDSAGHTFISYVVLTINVDFINIDINEVATTISSKGNIGYNGNGNQATQGLGFTYNGNQLLWEAGLMVGNSSTQVSDRVRGASGLDIDFNSLVNVSHQLPGIVSEFDVNGTFNDGGAGIANLPVKVMQSSYCWTTPGDTKFVIFKYKIVNTGNAPLSTLYAGILADWDIANSNLNKAEFDSLNKLGYAYCTQGGSAYAGIRLLTSTAPVNYYAVDNIAGGAGGIDPVGGISTAEKYIALSTNRYNAGGTGNGNDVYHILSSGPFSLLPNDTAVVGFALIAGDSLAEIQNSAFTAQIRFDGIVVNDFSFNHKNEISIYPNPANNEVYLDANDGKSQNNFEQLIIRDIAGKIVLTPTANNANGLTTINITNLKNGIYFISGLNNNHSFNKKLVINK